MAHVVLLNTLLIQSKGTMFNHFYSHITHNFFNFDKTERCSFHSLIGILSPFSVVFPTSTNRFNAVVHKEPATVGKVVAAGPAIGAPLARVGYGLPAVARPAVYHAGAAYLH